MADSEKLQLAEQAIEFIQNFDSKSLGRTDDLGRLLNFEEIVPVAENLIDIYKQIPISTLKDFPQAFLDTIISQAQSDSKLFDQIQTFQSNTPNASTARDQLISSINQRRDVLFQSVFNLIAYANAKYTDVKMIKKEANEAIAAITKNTSDIIEQLKKNKTDSDAVLNAIRKNAGEQGVSQEATHFKTEADKEELQAGEWLGRLNKLSLAISAFVLASLFLHKWKWIAPVDKLEAVQFVGAKIILFVFLAYLLVLCSRNYSAHKHNAVVNRHRQNALLTYKTLVEAGQETATQDIVLAHASACIFSPQETAFSSSKNESSGSKSVLELMTKNIKPSE